MIEWHRDPRGWAILIRLGFGLSIVLARWGDL